MNTIEKLQTIINSNVHQIFDPLAVQAAQEAIDEIERLQTENAALKEYFNKKYTLIDGIGFLSKCFKCRHLQSMAFRGADAPCYQCGIDKGYPKFKEDAE